MGNVVLPITYDHPLPYVLAIATDGIICRHDICRQGKSWQMPWPQPSSACSEFVCSLAARFCACASLAYFEASYTSHLRRLFRRETEAQTYIWPNSDTKSSIFTSKKFLAHAMRPPRILIILCSTQHPMVSVKNVRANFLFWCFVIFQSKYIITQ